MIKTITSLAACCAFVWAVGAGLFLLICYFFGFSFAAGQDIHNIDQSFSLYLVSIFSALRVQMHNTWLFLGAFGALGVGGLLWVIAEKWQHGTKWDAKEIARIAGFEALLGLGAIFYGLGTNGVLAKKFARSVTVTDVLSIGVAIAVPIFLWSQWRKGKSKSGRNGVADSASDFNSSRSILGLQRISSPALIDQTVHPTKIIEANARVMLRPITQPAEWLERTLYPGNESKNEPARDTAVKNEAAIMETTSNIVNIDAEPGPSESTAQTRTVIPAATFRSLLADMNASWQRIEDTGKEVEEWFQSQQKRVLAHLERHAGAVQDARLDLSRDFIEQKIQLVDAEWIFIHQVVREMNQWLEGSSAAQELSEATKVG